jgi:glycosyltransferase involved in cell wall biosynthesis
MLPLIAPGSSLVMLTEDVWYEMRNPRRPLRYKLGYRVFANWAARHAKRIMAISHASASGLTELFGIKPERISVNELAVRPAAPAEPMPGKYLLYVGQAFERRHLREALAAFEKVAAEDRELRFVAIGPDKYDPPCIDTMIDKINAELGRPAAQRIERVGDDELARFYRGALAVIYVSDQEAFGMPPVEALVYGTPAIVADKPVHREIFGQQAFYAATPDTDGIQKAMSEALTDTEKRKAIYDAAPGIVGRYTWKAHADRFISIVRKMV